MLAPIPSPRQEIASSPLNIPANEQRGHMVSVDEESVVDATQEAGPAKQPAKRGMPRWENSSRERVKAGIKKYSKALLDLRDRDANEADTRLFITDFLCDALGYDKYCELSTEYRVKGEYVDYGIRLDNDMTAFIEVKRLNTKLGPKHLRQVQSYAVNEGVEWIFLTNGAQWQVYHLSGGLPLVTDLALDVDLLSEDHIGRKGSPKARQAGRVVAGQACNLTQLPGSDTADSGSHRLREKAAQEADRV
jgi:hypothetical protein